MMAAPSFLQLVHEADQEPKNPFHLSRGFRSEVIADYKTMLHEVMLARIAAFTGDPEFSALTDELAGVLECENQYAAMQLYEVSSRVYAAAKGASYD